MTRINVLGAVLSLAVPVLCSAQAEGSESWRDQSPHRVRFVSVAPGVQLETLNWGGRGRPVLLLAGGGNTAHVFDDFALQLRKRYRVYGLTRRGSPPSSVPEDGYAIDQLGDDILAAISSLGLEKPVVIGHSFAGQEMSSLASRYPDRVAGIVYLDARHSTEPEYEAERFYLIKSWKDRLNAFRENFDELLTEPWDSRPLATEMLSKNVPELSAILKTLISIENGRPPRPDPTPDDLKDYRAVQAWYARNAKVVLPEAEFRHMLTPDENGRPTMKRRRPKFVGAKIDAGVRKITGVRVPALNISAVMNDPGYVDMSNPEARANSEAYVWFQTERVETNIALFRRDLPHAKVVRIERADHYVFLSSTDEVLQEINAFVDALDVMPARR